MPNTKNPRINPKKRKNKDLYMNIKFILIGLFFLINPNIEVFDILPDFIGLIFIMKGISHLAATDEKAGIARKHLMICTYINAAKTLTLLLQGVISESEMTWMLIFTLCFGTGEAVLMFLAFINLDRSLNYTGMIYSATNVYDRSSSFTGFTLAFIGLRTFMSILPEFVYLLDIDYGNVDTVLINWEFVTLLLYGLNVIVVLAMGIVWYINSRSYWKTVGAESDYLERIEEKYQKEVGTNIPLLTYRAFKTEALLLAIAAIFMICIRLDGIDILPDFVSAVLLGAAALRLKKLYPKHFKKALIASALFLIVSASEWWLWFEYCTSYYDTSTAAISFSETMQIFFYSSIEAYNNYIYLTVLDFVKVISALLAFGSFIPCINEIVRDHTGAIAEIREEVTIKKTKRIQKSLNIYTCIFAVIAVISLVFDPISVLVYFDLPIFIFITMILGIIFTVYVWIYTQKLTEAIENKYMY